jgi:hypothetical protein
MYHSLSSVSIGVKGYQGFLQWNFLLKSVLAALEKGHFLLKLRFPREPCLTVCRQWEIMEATLCDRKKLLSEI